MLFAQHRLKINQKELEGQQVKHQYQYLKIRERRRRKGRKEKKQKVLLQHKQDQDSLVFNGGIKMPKKKTITKKKAKKKVKQFRKKASKFIF